MICRRFATSSWSSLSAARWPMGGSLALDVTAAAQVEGIAAVFTAADVPGDNHFGPIFHDEELLAAHECHHIGQPIVVLAGESRAALRAARAAIRLELEALPADAVDRRCDRRRHISSVRPGGWRGAMSRPRWHGPST